jgi:ech hydrogenase subunit A
MPCLPTRVSMNILLFLLIFPAAVSLLFAILPPNSIRNTIVRLSCLLIAAGSIYAAIVFNGQGTFFFDANFPHLDKLFFAGEMVLSLFLLYKCRGIKPKEFYVPLLIVVQAGIMGYCELGGKMPEVKHAFYVDNFSLIMALIIGIIGSLICWYAVSYMKDYHHHHPEMKNRQRSFFFILFFFLSAMFGVVFSNNLVYLYLFWEITTLSSFILIGYPKTEEATRNAYKALGFNLIGGLGFACGILYLVKFCPAHTIELNRIIELGPAVMLIPVALISFAGIAKSAQMPFSSWLLGAMVAPTPVSALLHSSTMVKAGIFIIIKFAPVFQGTWVGFCIALVGGITFLMTSIIAVTQNNAKRVLAYSTIANLGLIVA